MKCAMKTECQTEFSEVITLNARYNANDRKWKQNISEMTTIPIVQLRHNRLVIKDNGISKFYPTLTALPHHILPYPGDLETSSPKGNDRSPESNVPMSNFI